MSYMSKDEFDTDVNAYKRFQNALDKFADDYLDYYTMNWKAGYAGVTNVTVEEEMIYISFYTHIHGCNDSDQKEVPLEYLYTDDWETLLVEREAAKQAAKEERERIEQEETARYAKGERYKAYRKLHEEFGDGPIEA